MKKIVSGIFDDIDQEYADAKSKYDQYEDQRSQEIGNYNRAMNQASKNVKDYIQALFIDNGGSGSWFNDNIDVELTDRFDETTIKVSYGYAGSDRDKALRWEWEYVMKNDSPSRETNSWSGLNAVTMDQIDELQNSILLLKALATVSDEELNESLDAISIPNISDFSSDVKYVTPPDSSYYTLKKLDRLAQEGGYLVKLEREDDRKVRNVWYRLNSMTDKFYKVTRCSTLRDDLDVQYDLRVSKDKLLGMIERPLVYRAEKDF